MVLPPLDFESSASAISPPRLQVSTGKIVARNDLIKKKKQETKFWALNQKGFPSARLIPALHRPDKEIPQYTPRRD